MTRTRSRRTWLALLAAVLAAPLAAQRGDVRADFASWQDSLHQIADPDVLRTLHRTTLRQADSLKGDPRAELRLGAVGLRLAELTGESRLMEQAARAFTGVTEDHPEWPLGWTGLAEAELALARSGGSVAFGLQRMLGLDPVAKLVSLYLRGTGADSAEVAGVLAVSRRALRGRDRLEEDVALRALRMLPARLLVRHADVALARVALEREIGDKDSASAVIERAARSLRDDPLILRAQAQVRFVVGRADGAGPWYQGLVRAEGDALERYASDLQLIVPDSVMQRFRAAHGEARAAVIREFWRRQDPDGLPTDPDRLAEHYRRLEFARHHYVRTTLQRSAAAYEIDTLGIAAFDARGEMILRHGSPTVRTSIGDHGGPEVQVTLRIIGMPPNESWTYTRPDSGSFFFHFVRPGPDQDFVAVPSILDVVALSQQFQRFRPGGAALSPGDTTHRTILLHGAELASVVAQEVLVSRHPMSPLYQAMIDEGIGAADSLQRLERDIGRAALAREYTYELGFELPLDAAIDIRTIGSDRGGPVVQVAFAIAATDLTPQSMPRGVVYPIRMRLAALGADGRIVAQIDTTRGFLTPNRLTPSQYLLGQLPLRLPPGTWRVRASLESERRGMLSAPFSIAVPEDHPATPTMSDVSIGLRSVPIRWRAPSSDTAWANPIGRYRLDEEMQVYFEVSGIAEGIRYRTQLALDRIEGPWPITCDGRGTALTLSFEGDAPGGVSREQRALTLDRLRPGRYQLTVTVSTPDGARATRCRTFTVTRE